jgi:hypothetical protein
MEESSVVKGNQCSEMAKDDDYDIVKEVSSPARARVEPPKHGENKKIQPMTCQEQENPA